MRHTENDESALLIFSEGALVMGLVAARIVAVGELPQVQPVPRPAPAMLGFYSHQGTLVPIARLSKLLGIAAGPARYSILVEEDGILLALAVQQVESAVRVPISVMRHTRGAFGALPARFVRAVAQTETEFPILNLAPLVDPFRVHRPSEGPSRARASQILEPVLEGLAS